MQKIIFPLQDGDKGAEIKNLHAAIMELGPKMNIPGFLDLFKTPEFMSTFLQERKDEIYGQGTRQVVSTFQVIYMQVAPTGVVDESTADVLNGLLEQYGLIPAPPATVVTYSITGTVYDEWIEPLTGATVKASGQGMRSEQALGEAVTDGQGKYIILYGGGAAGQTGVGTTGAGVAAANAGTGTAAADVVLRLYGNNGALLYTSPVYYDAPAQLQADIDLGPFPYRGDAEFSAAVKKITPYLGNLSIDQLNETNDVHDLSYLIGKTGIEGDALLALVAAYRFEKWTGLTAAIFYGVLRELGSLDEIDGQGIALPADVDSSLQQVYIDLWANPVATLMAAFQEAADNNIIPYKLWADQANVQAQLQRLKQAPPSAPGGTVALPGIYQQVALAGLNADQSFTVLESYQANGVDDDYWAGLAGSDAFKNDPGTLNKLKVVWQLSDWTSGITGLASTIMSQHKIAAPDDLRSLVAYDTNDWVSMLNTAGANGSNGTVVADVQTIAATIAAGIEALYPTPVFAARFGKASNLPIVNKDYIGGILNQGDFDILKTSVPSYLSSYLSKNPLPDGSDQDTVTYKLMGLQRVYKTVQSADASLTLLSANIQSARQIYAMGKTSFVNQYQQTLGSADKAGAVFEQAATAHAGAAYLTGKMVSTLNNPATNLLPDYSSQLKSGQLAKDHPDLAKLFGVGASYCECKACHSFLSLAAYLTDLLDFLYERKIPGGPPNNARAVLLANSYVSHGNHWRRRPDLGDIDLTCENTNTELPYIDIVNELLEDYIIPPIAGIEVKLSGNDPKGIYHQFITWVLVVLGAGKIHPLLYNLLMRIGQDPKTPICNISLLTPEAEVSSVFYADNENFPSWIFEQWIPQWIIRDRYITLKIALAINPQTIDLLPTIFGKDPIVVDIDQGLNTPGSGSGILGNIYNENTFAGETGRTQVTGFALIVQEIHETHLSTEVISTNPEYTNSNVYNSLSDPLNTAGQNKWDLYPDRIAIDLPYDLHFSQANTYLEKMGKKRYELLATFGQETGRIAFAYLGISTGDAAIIFTALPGQQGKFWGAAIASTNQPEVDLFLIASGLSFIQLETLLKLSFINPAGDSYIANTDAGCNIAKMVITAMTADKLDRINRFLRLWNKVKALATFSMPELDACILSTALGNGALDQPFAISLYYFLRVMGALSLDATRALILYQDMGTTGNNNLYEQLFQNRRISNPLVAAFHLPLPTGPQVTKIADTQANPGAIPVILTTCGLTQEDLTVILSRDNGAYGDLSVTNLSFIAACGLLCRGLGCTADQLFTFAGLLGVNPLRAVLGGQSAATPQTTIHFIIAYRELQNAGLSVDELNYLLANQSTAVPSLIPDADTVVAGLADLRSGLQAAVTATTPVPDPKGVLLQKWLADPVLGWNKTIAAKLMAILGSFTTGGFETQVQENVRFLELLQTHYPVSSASTYLERLPVITLPDHTIAGIQFDTTQYYLFYGGAMSDDFRKFLTGLAPDATSQAAVASLYTRSQDFPIAAVLLPGAVPAAPPAWVGQGQQNIPAFSGGAGVLGFAGPMSAAVYAALLGQRDDPGYGAALGQLFLSSQGSVSTVYVRLAALPPIALPDNNVGSLAYDVVAKMLSFAGAMSFADLRFLLALSADTNFQAAIGQLYVQSQGAQGATVALAVLPAGWAQLPDVGAMAGFGASAGQLTFSGPMDAAVESALLGLSPNAQWQAAIQTLYTSSHSQAVSSVAALLPSIVLPLPDTALGTVGYTAGAIVFNGVPNAECMDEFNLQQLGGDEYGDAISFIYSGVNPAGCTGIVAGSLPSISLPGGMAIAWSGGELGFTGQMQAADLAALQQLSPDAAWQAAINQLFTNSRPNTVCTVPLAALPPVSIPSGLNVHYDAKTGVLYYQGALPIPAATITTLRQLSSAVDYQAALDVLAAAGIAGTFVIYAPAPLVPLNTVVLAAGNISYQGGQLNIVKPMAFEDCAGLLSLSADPAYQQAVMDLYLGVAPARQIGLPAISIPALYSGQLSWNAVGSQLTLNGVIADADRTALLSLGQRYDWQQAIGNLYTAVEGSAYPFTGLYEEMITATDAADLYDFFLQAISPVYRPLMEAEAIAAKVAGNFGVSAAVAAALVGGLPDLFATLTDPLFAANSKPINPDSLQSVQALWYMKLARIGFLVDAYTISAGDVSWLLDNAAAFQLLSLDAWPSAATPLPFSQWQLFNQLRSLQQRYMPVDSNSVYSILTEAQTVAKDLASVPVIPPNTGQLMDDVVRLTGWNPAELTAALGNITGLADIAVVRQLSEQFTVAGQLKVVPSRCKTWVADPITDTIAVDIKQALKALYPDEKSWTAAIVPLMNSLRMERRDAVLSYLLSNSVNNPFSYGIPGNKFNVFPDEFAVYGNFLIDAEMAACQPTTRIIQGYCSVQLFVQRCLMNSEAPLITVNDDPFTGDPDWRQWTWMGTAESWYEARYTFLFPENLILPQTLPGQSVFFENLQNDLTQGPVTLDIVTTAFSNYLESLDQVARLQIKGTWYDEPTGTLYVFGRTYGGTAPAYYFRTRGAGGRWSAWEAVTADISGDTIIPVVQNGRLYLYWPVFTSATDEDKKKQTQKASGNSKGDISASTPPPVQYWKIQMAFSEYRNGKWSGKNLSTDYLTCQQLPTTGSHYPPFPDTSDFVFFAVDIPVKNANAYEGAVAAVRTNNEMVIACFLNGEVTVTFKIHFNSSSKSVVFLDEGVFKMTVELQNFTMSNKELLQQITAFLASNGVYVILIDHFTLDLLSPDLAKTIENYLDPPLNPWHVTATVDSISFSASGSKSLISLLKGTDNAFLLDAARGFPTTVDLSNFAKYDSKIGDLWFDGSNFDNMLLVGQDPLEDNKGHAILSTPKGAIYQNLVSLQMGIWAKYAYFTGKKLSLKYLGNLMPFFYQDKTRAFLVNQAMTLSGKKLDYPAAVAEFFTTNGNPSLLSQFFSVSSALTPDNGPAYQFINFYHPFAQYFLKILVQEDLTAILARPIQLTGDDKYATITEVNQNLIHATGYKNFSFKDNYSPAATVKDLDQSEIEKGYPLEQLDFDLTSSYGQYNWELFFHGVLLSCMQLTQNQQFEAADNFIKSILNLTDGSSHKAPQKYWVTKPFFENTDTQLSLDEQVLLYELDPASQKKFWDSVKLWRNDPYDPHRLAQMRITPYMYTTFMRWMDNRIVWADHNYTQYTMESVNIAIQLYMSVLEALGPKPQAIPPVTKLPVCNYYQVELNLEVLMNAEGPNGYLSDPIVLAENLLPPSPGGGSGSGGSKKIQMVPGLYFCIPPNELLLSYWDKVETQLNKIRNCMNIKGQFQPLSPFPNIPGLFGADGSGIGDFGGVLPPRRFTVLLQKATELCNEARALGASLLSALEKQDAEGLALLRSTQDIAVQKSIDRVRQLQITDAELGLQNLEDYKNVLQDKIAYYSGLVQNGGLIALERQELSLAQFSLSMQMPIQATTQIAAGLKNLPNFTIGVNGVFGSPCVTYTVGGVTFGAAADSAVSLLSFISLFAGKTGELAKVNAGYTRRLAEWNFQLQLANDELTQTNTQIQAAQNKIAIANQEEANQQQIIANAENVDSFLRNKYTNQQLYSWIVSKLSGIYFQSYQLAYAMAKQAEVCFGYELGITGSSYIEYGYWDSLHKGLLSGDALMASLKQMESDYLNLDVREYELTRSISLAQLDPVALLQLKTRKSCYINIPEELFDLDYPGHYFRRAKHISITLPGVVGAYTPVCLKMTLLNNSVRIDPAAGTVSSYPRNRNASGSPTNDKRFLDNVAAVQYIATSTGVNDNGLFEMNLHDERYLPFERAGAISSWQIELPSVYAQFDLDSITDLIIQFSYTSRDGGTALQAAASESLQKKLATVLSAPDLVLMRSFSARRDFPTQWYKFLHPANAADAQELDMDITRRLPFITQGRTVKISGVAALVDIPPGAAGSLPPLYLTGTKVKDQLIGLGPDDRFGTMLYSLMPCRDEPGVWKVTTAAGGSVVSEDEVDDLILVFYYSLA